MIILGSASEIGSQIEKQVLICASCLSENYQRVVRIPGDYYICILVNFYSGKHVLFYEFQP